MKHQLLILMNLIIFSSTIQATNLEPFPENSHLNSCYLIDKNNSSTINSYSCNYKYLEIPTTIDGWYIVNIGESAFRGFSLKNIDFPKKLSSIGSHAFSNNMIEQVSFPSSLKTINSYAILDNSITYIKIPNGVTVIRRGTFQDNNLHRIELPRSVKSIEENAFFDNSDLRWIRIGSNVRIQSQGLPRAFIKAYEKEFMAPGLYKRKSKRKWTLYSMD